MAQRKTITVPDLSNIDSRDGLREFVRVLHRWLKEYVATQDGFNQHVSRELTPLTWAAPIAAASTIEPTSPLQPITGSTPIQTIGAGAQSSRFILMAEDGFTLITGGNIASAVDVGVGQSVELLLNYTDMLWYPQGGGGSGLFTNANSRANAVRIGGDTEARQWFVYWDSTDGLIMEAGVASNTRARIAVDKTGGIYDVEQAQDIATVDPDNPSGANAGFALMAKEVGADPTGNPPAGWRYLYPKSTGWYEKDSAGTVTKVTN